MPTTSVPITLIESFMISPRVKHFVFQSEFSLNYQPGQFFTIHFEHAGKTFKRSYSIANSPKDDNRIECAAGYVANGPGSEFLFHLKSGDVVTISGPFGRLVFKDELPGRYILVATSTGITPYRAMLDELSKRLAQHPHLTAVILQGVQKREDILYADEFRAFVQKHPQVTFRVHLSQERPHELYHDEYAGYVQQAFAELNLNPKEDMVYLCGNPGMIDDGLQYLKEHDFAIERIIREKYISN